MRLIELLQGQDYPQDKLEIVIADDGLTDHSRMMLDEIASANDRFKVVSSQLGDERLINKKRALDAAVSASWGDILLFTDVDCIVEPGWVRAMASSFTPDIDYVIGWSQIGFGHLAPHEIERPDQVFEQLDFAMLLLAARGCTQMGTPWASTGQNQAYRRSVFEELGGFFQLADRLQGDDSLFLQLARKQLHTKVAFCTQPASHVIRLSTGGWENLLWQRIRWAADALVMWKYNPLFAPIPAAIFMVNALLLLFGAMVFSQPDVIMPILVPGLLIKAAADGVFLAVGASKVDLDEMPRHFPLWFIIQIPYIVVVGIGSFWGNRLAWRPKSGKP